MADEEAGAPAPVHDVITDALLRHRRVVTAAVVLLVFAATLFVAVSLLLAVDQPWTGLTMTRTGEDAAARVTVLGVTRGSPAAAAAIRTGDVIGTEKVVNATGAWCAPLAATAGVELPVEPVMRTVYVIDTRLDHRGHPSVFLPSGLYVLPEGEGRFAVGWSLPDDPVGDDFTFNRQRFDEMVWPELATQLPAFEALHLASGWTGLYEVNTLDGNGIIGEWPDLPGMFLANGFSGHGFQHCHAVGRHLAELILGRRTTLDLSRLGPQRILDQEPLYENPSRII